MSAASITSLAQVLKTLYPKGIEEILYENAPLVARINKSTDWEGNIFQQPMMYAPQAGIGADYTTAANASVGNAYAGFQMTRKPVIGVGSISTEALRAARLGKGSVVDGFKAEMDGLLYTLRRFLCASLYGNGGGAIGRAASGTTTATITLANITDIINFDVGKTVRASAADGTSGALKTGSAVIIAVDRNAGTLTTTAAWDSLISTFTTNDYLFTTNLFGNVPVGLAGFLPASAPSSTPFYGQDRTVDSRLYGCIKDGGGQPIEDTLQDAMEIVFRNGGMVNSIYMHSIRAAQLSKALGSKVQYQRMGVKGMSADFGFQAFSVQGASGEAKIYADPSCPKDRYYGLMDKTWNFKSLGEFPGLLNDDGNDYLRSASADAIEFRYGGYGNLVSAAPGWNVTGSFGLP